MAERANRLGKRHWQRFSRQNYFDDSGVFMSVLVSGPLLLVMFIVLVGPPAAPGPSPADRRGWHAAGWIGTVRVGPVPPPLHGLCIGLRMRRVILKKLLIFL